jgi:hypothetical protein
MPCHAMHPIQDLFLESFSYELQFDMQFLYALLFAQIFYSCKKWVLQYVFGPLVCPSLLCLCYGSTIVIIEIHRTGHTRNNTQLRNKISDPNSFRRRNVLSFHCQICYSILLGTFPAHRPSIEAEQKTGLRFRIIYIYLEVSITVTLYNELFFTSKHKERFLGSSRVL